MHRSHRLPRHIYPLNYKLTIQPDLDSKFFFGKETIQIVIQKSTRTIILHCKDLEITRAEIAKSSAETIIYNKQSENVKLTFAKLLTKGTYKLHLHFTGLISNKLHGLYLSHYSHNGQQKSMAVTQFEATDARRAFPCFDEPEHKATFELQFILPPHLSVISNTVENLQNNSQVTSALALSREHLSNNHKTITFKKTPKMSTYLLAYVIGEFDTISQRTKRGVLVRVSTTKGKKSLASFALKTAVKALDFLESYFGINYPLDTLDLIAIPDFSAGAMENWGAITFRETALLVDEKHTPIVNRQNVAEVIAHELVHQWFGNLVTMKWWTHLWLNESFASFMSYLVIDHVFPEWKIWSRFVLNSQLNAFELDSLQGSHPVEVVVHHPNQISEIFDAISYDKGASLLRMLHNYLGAEPFQKGLHYYLKSHAYSNTSTEDLWEALELVSKKPVRKIMTKWIKTQGYPVVFVKKINAESLQISQKPFQYKSITKPQTWPIPVQFLYNKNKTSPLEIFDKTNKIFKIDSTHKFVKANPSEISFHRTIYSPELLAELSRTFQNKELSVIDRFGLVRDLSDSIKAGELPTSAFIELLDQFKYEESYTVWAGIIRMMSDIHTLVFHKPKLKGKLELKYTEILKPIANKIGWTEKSGESQSQTLLRGIVLQALGMYGDLSTQKQAKRMFKNRLSKPIPQNLRNTIYNLVGLTASPTLIKTFIKMHDATNLQEEQRRVVIAMTKTSNPAGFRVLLELFATDKFRQQDLAIYIAHALLNQHHSKTMRHWIIKNWKSIYTKYHDDHLLTFIIRTFGNVIDKDNQTFVKQFFIKNPVPFASRALEQAKEKIEIGLAWQKRDLKDIQRCINS